MNKTIRLSGIAYESLVNGPGMRRVFFAQGCTHNCNGVVLTQKLMILMVEKKEI